MFDAGCAADIVKLAMIATRKVLDSAVNPDVRAVRMVLQIHDELLFEAPTATASSVALLIARAMESVPAKLGVTTPFPVRIECGASWGTLEPFSH